MSDEGLQQNDYKYFQQIAYSIKTITNCELFKNYWKRLNVTSAPFRIADRRRCLTVRLNEDNFYKSIRSIRYHWGLAVIRRMMNNFAALQLNTRNKMHWIK